MKKLTLLVVGLALLAVVVGGLGLRARSQRVPQLNAADTLAIRSAQVALLKLQPQLQDVVAKYKAQQAALEAAMQKGVVDAGADPEKYTVVERGDQLVIESKAAATPEVKK